MLVLTSKNESEGHADVEVVLHDEELFAGEECTDGGESHVRAGNSGLAVEGGEPFLGEDAHANRGLLDGAGSKNTKNWELFNKNPVHIDI